jgi:hypothetical protein
MREQLGFMGPDLRGILLRTIAGLAIASIAAFFYRLCQVRMQMRRAFRAPGVVSDASRSLSYWRRVDRNAFTPTFGRLLTNELVSSPYRIRSSLDTSL